MRDCDCYRWCLGSVCVSLVKALPKYRGQICIIRMLLKPPHQNPFESILFQPLAAEEKRKWAGLASARSPQQDQEQTGKGQWCSSRDSSLGLETSRDSFFESRSWSWSWRRCEGVHVPHSRPAPRAQSTDRRRRPDSRVQHRRVEARLLQRPVVWCTGDDIRQAPAYTEQPGQSRLPEPGSHRRQAAAPVTSLTGSQWDSGSPTKWLCWPTRCGPQPLRRISVTWYRLAYRSGLCAHLRLTAGRPTDTYRTGSTRFLCRSPIRLELFTCRHSTVRERSLI